MDNLGLDKYLNIINEEKEKRGLNTWIPLYPMLRIYNDKLYIGVLITEENENVWDKDSKIKPQCWALIDIDTNNIIEFNKTLEKDFVIGNLINKNIENKQMEISKYTVKKALQYKNYLIDDIKNDQSRIQKKLSNILEGEINVDGQMININDYLISHLEEDINDKVNELVDILVQSKYGSIIFYYCNLYKQIIEEYKNNKTINKDKIALCIEIMDYYYDGVIGINNFFNI